MSAHPVSFPQAVPQRLSRLCKQLFVVVALLIVCGAIVRSAVATRLDGFTLDEAYHITAGVSYVRYADFRINPEHPPLVKLWVGSFMSATGFHLSSLRPFADKSDERAFAEQDVYLHNDFNSIQRRARIAMWTLNGLLLTLFAFAVRRVFGFGVAIGALLFLAINPTVAAHLPVVMTDLPVSLLSATAVVLAARAFLPGHGATLSRAPSRSVSRWQPNTRPLSSWCSLFSPAQCSLSLRPSAATGLPDSIGLPN